MHRLFILWSVAGLWFGGEGDMRYQICSILRGQLLDHERKQDGPARDRQLEDGTEAGTACARTPKRWTDKG